ncbi:uncharacterized protein ACIBXB_022508 [Morphnus guianensis]
MPGRCLPLLLTSPCLLSCVCDPCDCGLGVPSSSAGVMVMPWSFGLLCWLTGRNELDILGPSAGGTAFLDPDAFCSRPASFAAERLLRSCPCTLPCRLAMRQCPDGQQRARLLPDASLHCWARFLQHRAAILAARGRREVPGPGLQAADGNPASAPAVAGSLARPASGPPPTACQGETCPCAAGPAEPVEPELPGSPPAAAPHPGQPVCPAACREGAACLGSARAQRAGSCRRQGVPGLPRGSGRGAGSRRSREPAPAVGGGRRAWEPPAAPPEPWMALAMLAWLDPAGISVSRWQAWGFPRLLSGMSAGLQTWQASLHPPHRTPWPSVGSSSFAPVLRGAARRWGGSIRDGDWRVGSLSTWSRVAAGLPEQQMVAAWGPAIRPSGRLFTRRHDDRKVSEKIPCDSRVELVGLGVAQEGGLGGR